MSSPVLVHFARHAETLFNAKGRVQGWCDAPLTARGVLQAEALGQKFADVPLRAIHVSDLTRTRATAAPTIARHPHLAPVFTTNLREWSFGWWEGEPNGDLWAAVFSAMQLDLAPDAHWADAGSLDELLDAVAASDPDGTAENGAAIAARRDAAIAALVAAAGDGGEVLAVTHGAMLGSLVESLAPGELDRIVPNCAVATVRIDGSSSELVAFDTSASLGAPPRPAAGQALASTLEE
jgi:broad specificity phosphatase PhoE